MDKRELYREFELIGRKWRIGKWDARTGSYWAHKFLTEAPPASVTRELANSGPFGTKAMSKPDFFDLQNDCLAVCEEKLAAGWTHIVNDDGNFAVPDLENDGGSVLMFTIQSIDWNLNRFFDESALASLNSPSGTSQSGA
jgi:hypothetical protein